MLKELAYSRVAPLRMVLYYGMLGARVAELADAPDLGSGIRKDVGVRVPPFARISKFWSKIAANS